MSENKMQESLTNVIAEGRSYKGFPVPYAPARAIWLDDFNSFLDRIEAAHKREIEKLNSVIQAQRSAFDAEQDRQRREREKLRKMLAQMAQTATAARTCRSDEEILRTAYLEDIAKLWEAALALLSNSPENENSGGDNFTAGKQELNANSKSAQIEFGNAAKDGRGDESPRTGQESEVSHGNA